MLYSTVLGLDADKSGEKKPYKFNPLSEKGWIKFLLLRLLYDEPKHGYQLLNELVEKDYVLPEKLSVGSIYIILNRMDKYGFTTSETETSEEKRVRRTYTITEKGKGILKSGLETVLQRKATLEDLTDFYNTHFEDEPK